MIITMFLLSVVIISHWYPRPFLPRCHFPRSQPWDSQIRSSACSTRWALPRNIYSRATVWPCRVPDHMYTPASPWTFFPLHSILPLAKIPRREKINKNTGIAAQYYECVCVCVHLGRAGRGMRLPCHYYSRGVGGGGCKKQGFWPTLYST